MRARNPVREEDLLDDLTHEEVDEEDFKRGDDAYAAALKLSPELAALMGEDSPSPDDDTVKRSLEWLTRGEWNPEDHPQAPAGSPEGGQFIPKDGGGASSGSGEKLGGTQPTPAPKSAEVPHDFAHLSKHDQQLHMQLVERQQMAIVNVEKMIEEANSSTPPVFASGTESSSDNTDDESAPIIPDTWDGIPEALQQEAKEAWEKSVQDDLQQSEENDVTENYAPKWGVEHVIESIDESGYGDKALREALVEAGVTEASADAFVEANTPSKILDPKLMDKWDEKPVKEGEALGGLNLTPEELVGQLEFLPREEMEDLAKDAPWPPSIDVPAGQADLPGMEGQAAGNASARDFFNQLDHDIGDKLLSIAGDAQSNFPATDYVDQSSIDETKEMLWDEKDHDEKFEIAKEHLDSNLFDVGYDPETGEIMSETPDGPAPVSVKVDLDALNNLPDDLAADRLLNEDKYGYEKVQAFARASQQLLTAKYIEGKLTQGIDPNDKKAIAAAKASAARLASEEGKKFWVGWKGSSTGDVGLSMQYIASQEFGTAFQPELGMGKRPVDMDEVKGYIGASIDGKLTRGDLIRAHLRATWETSQYLMHKAGVDHLDTYRGIMVDGDIVRASRDLGYQEIYPDNLQGRAFEYLNNFQTWRNGLQSWTSKRSVANEWKGVGNLPPNPERVVLRSRMPATAVLSLPVFGENITHEREIVALGAPLRQWDAWRYLAPKLADWDPDEHPRDDKGRFINAPGGEDIITHAMTRAVRRQAMDGQVYSGGKNVQGPIVLVEDHGWMSTGKPGLKSKPKATVSKTDLARVKAKLKTRAWIEGGG